MIPSVIIFLVVVSLVGAAGAAVTEAGLRRLGAPARWIWLAALGLGPVMLGVGLAVPARASSAVSSGAASLLPVIELPGLIVGRGGWSVGPTLTLTLLAIWVALSVAVLASLVRAHRRLLQESAGWQTRRVLGRDVLVSPNRGPAVAGIVRPWIVLPEWTLALPEAELRMVLIHEEEHLRARDSFLLTVALLFVAFTAWNPVVWWHLRRLKLAVELDCDGRVLRRDPDRETYGATLLAVASRTARPSLALAAFSESPSSLKQRILAMTAKTTRWTGLGGVLLVVLGAVIGVQACGVENPMAPDVTSDVVPEAPEAVEIPSPTAALGKPRILEGDPNFTPFTVAPSILNREEVIAALAREYPPLLREAGVEGTVQMWSYVTVEGVIQDIRIDESSGHPALDEAAIRVAWVFRFVPAENRGEVVPVWVSIPITFAVRR